MTLKRRISKMEQGHMKEDTPELFFRFNSDHLKQLATGDIFTNDEFTEYSTGKRIHVAGRVLPTDPQDEAPRFLQANYTGDS